MINFCQITQKWVIVILISALWYPKFMGFIDYNEKYPNRNKFFQNYIKKFKYENIEGPNFFVSSGTAAVESKVICS